MTPLGLKVAFLVQDLQLSGGVGVIVEHAGQLRRHHGIDVALVLARSQRRPAWGYRGLEEIPVLDLDEAAERSWDIAVATWWETTTVLFRLPAQRHVYFAQALEDSAYPPHTSERLAATLTTALPVRFLTEARWIAELLERLQPGSHVHYVRNGIPKEVFPPVDSVVPPPADEPLRIVVEGTRTQRQKGVDDALRAVALMREPADVTWITPDEDPVVPEGVTRMLRRLTHAEMAALLREQHVMLKLSRNEGMYGPPLEAFHCGATLVTTAVTGHDEYVVHGENALVVGWDDHHGTARALDLLAKDRVLLHRLRRGALDTARAWPDWETSSSLMASALRRIASDPPPLPTPAATRLTSDLASVLAEGQRWERSLENRVAMDKALRDQKAWQYAIRARAILHRARRVRSGVRRLRPR